MEEQYYQPYWLGKYFGNPVQRVILNGSGVELINNKSEQVALKWADINCSPEIISGILFDKVIFQSAGRKYSIGWLNQESAFSLNSLSSQAFYLHRAKYAKKALTQISAYLKKAGYLRSRHCEVISALALKALEPINQWSADFDLPGEITEVFCELQHWAESTPNFIKGVRDSYVAEEKQRYQHLFDSIESNPLTEKQRDACIIDDDNNLVLAGAGTGKTSTMIGRTAYLINSGQAEAKEILMLAYGNKAAVEMRERMAEKLEGVSVVARTFHSLGQQIIIQVEKGKPSISPLASDEKLLVKHVDQWFNERLQQPDYKHTALQYFEKFLYPEANPFDFTSEGEYFEYLRVNEIRTLKGEAVKSYEECLIANWLFRMGIEYQYEMTYKESSTRSPDFRAYRPNFYLTEAGIYIEHFGIDRQGNTAPYIDKFTYQEGMTWKRQLHDEHGTTLIESYHYEQQENCLLSNLEEKLKSAGVLFDPLPSDAVLDTLKEFGAINNFSGLLSQLLQRFRANWFDAESLSKKINASANSDQLSAAMDLLFPMIDRYEDLLKMNDEIDFDDMIGKAISYVEQGLFKSPWRFILVDEFQDISEPRARLVKALRDSKKETSIFCVGDDWQAIYRFTGSDVSLTTGFEQHFGPTQTTSLDKTFRFNNSIRDIASRFVMQNPAQVKKQMTTHETVAAPAVSVVRRSITKNESYEPLFEILEKISERAEPGSSVYLLARYWFKLPELDDWKRIQRQFPSLKIEKLSFHASKGKEADYVVILGLDNSKDGFPSRKETHPLLEALLPSAEPYEHAEERRLFYVALTRARHRVYLLCDMSEASEFVKELISDKYPVELDEFTTSPSQLAAEETKCPKCNTGTLLQRKSGTSTFLGCSNYPLCNHSENTCTKCSQEMKRQGRFRVCIDSRCNYRIPTCPSCNGDLKLRSSRHGPFLGCMNYRSEGPSCEHTEKVVEQVAHQ